MWRLDVESTTYIIGQNNNEMPACVARWIAAPIGNPNMRKSDLLMASNVELRRAGGIIL